MTLIAQAPGWISLLFAAASHHPADLCNYAFTRGTCPNHCYIVLQMQGSFLQQSEWCLLVSTTLPLQAGNIKVLYNKMNLLTRGVSTLNSPNLCLRISYFGSISAIVCGNTNLTAGQIAILYSSDILTVKI